MEKFAYRAVNEGRSWGTPLEMRKNLRVSVRCVALTYSFIGMAKKSVIRHVAYPSNEDLRSLMFRKPRTNGFSFRFFISSNTS